MPTRLSSRRTLRVRLAHAGRRKRTTLWYRTDGGAWRRRRNKNDGHSGRGEGHGARGRV
ncbi:unnamed protein product, partial [Pylaiella littoralis]